MVYGKSRALGDCDSGGSAAAVATKASVTKLHPDLLASSSAS